MVIMAVDLGDVRSGLAICDKQEILASPVCVITETSTNALVAVIAQKAVQTKAELIVVGNPKNMDSSCGERSEKSRNIALRIEELSGIKTVLWDERLTTVSAHNALNATNTRGKKRKAVVDAVAATIILQDYLNYRKLNS